MTKGFGKAMIPQARNRLETRSARFRWACLAGALVTAACLFETGEKAPGPDRAPGDTAVAGADTLPPGKGPQDTTVIDTTGNDSAGPAPSWGRLWREDGSPAPDAEVAFFPVEGSAPDYRAEEPGGVTRTDSLGRFRAPAGMAAGRYNVFFEAGGKSAVAESVRVEDSVSALPEDTLRDPGFVTGEIALDNGDYSRSVSSFQARVRGSRFLFPVGKTGLTRGSFRLGPLPEGRYWVRLETPQDYLPLDIPIRVRAGREDTLKDELRPRVATAVLGSGNVWVEYDSLQGRVWVRWNPLPGTGDERIYRAPAENPENWSSVLSFPDLPWKGDSATGGEGKRLIYKVVAQTPRESDVGKTEVLLARPSAQQLSFSYGTEKGGGWEPSPNPAFNIPVLGWPMIVKARFRYPGRRLVKVDWFAENSARILHSEPLEGDEPESRFEHTWQYDKGFAAFGGVSAPGGVYWDAGISIAIMARVTDDRGSTWPAQFRVLIPRDSLIAQAGRDRQCVAGDTLTLEGKANRLFGKIVSRSWDIGGKGEWTSTVDGRILIKAPSVPTKSLPCIFKATDDRGWGSQDTVLIEVIADQGPRPIEIPSPPLGAVTVFAPAMGKPYVGNPGWRGVVSPWGGFIWNTETSRWEETGSINNDESYAGGDFGLFAIFQQQSLAILIPPPLKILPIPGNFLLWPWGNTTWVGNKPFYADSNISTHVLRMFLYDPALDSMVAIPVPTLPDSMGKPRFLQFAGRLILLGPRDPAVTLAYDEAASAWTHLPERTRSGTLLGTFEAQSKLHVVYADGSMEVYDPVQSAWTGLPSWQDAGAPEQVIVPAAGQGHGVTRKDGRLKLSSFDPATGGWVTRFDIEEPAGLARGMEVIGCGNSIYLRFGVRIFRFPLP